MKTKSFDAYLKQRLNKKEIKEIEAASKIELEALKTLQTDLAKEILHYMSENNIGFNEFVKKSGKNPAQISRITKGQANPTLATVAQLYAIMGRKAHIVPG